MRVKLIDLCTPKQWKTLQTSELLEEGYPVYGANGIIGYYSEYNHEKSVIAITCRGATCGTINITVPESYVTGNAMCLDNVRSDVLQKYLYYCLQHYDFNNVISGSAQPQITRQGLEKVEIELCSLEEQRRIITILDNVSAEIAGRKRQNQKLEELIKSRFVEMFGNPIKNTQNRPTTIFADVVTMQRGFDLPVQDRQQDGTVPVYGSNGVLGHHNIAKVHGGGVITGRSGTIGKVFYAEGDFWPLNTSLFSVNTHGNNIVYLAYLLQMYNLSRFTEGTGVPTLNRNKFHGEQIIDIPRSEQDSFAAFVTEVDKSKLAVKQSLEKLETLKKSLMQQYFG